MKEFGKILKEARLELKLSIQEVSNKTKIRPHILDSIEKNELESLPSIYQKSFIRTYAKFLNIPSDITSEFFNETIENVEDKKLVYDANKIEDYSKAHKKQEPFSYSVLSKKKRTNFGGIFYYALYVLAFIVIVALSYLIFVPQPTKINRGQSDLPSGASTADTTIISTSKNNLLSYFEKKDSLELVASAIDTAWLRIEIDGKSFEEVLMTPTSKHRWTADEYFLITQGNVGAIQFQRNGELLEPFGRRGTVVRNVRITKDSVFNVNPLDASSQANQQTPMRRKQKVEPEPPKLIQPSQIPRQVNLREQSKPPVKNENTEEKEPIQTESEKNPDDY